MTKRFTRTFAVIIFIFVWIIITEWSKKFFVIESDFGTFETAVGAFLFACIIHPLWEELIFRYVPIMMTRKIKKQTGYDYTIYAVLLSSIIFASGHQNGEYNVILQGVVGFVLSYLFIANGYKYWYNVLAHAAWNIGVMYLFPLLGL